MGRLSADLDHLSAGIEAGFSELSASFNWGFSQMLASLGGMADSIQELVRISKTPTQTAAYEHFQLARDNFRKGLLEECLDELRVAIAGDHVSSGFKTEWRFHHLEGLVRLGSFAHPDPDLIDPAAAEAAFLLAARYARADEPREAARALLAAGFAAYAQAPEHAGKLRDALKHTEAALALDRGLGEAAFQLSKVHMALGQPRAALPKLRAAIKRDASYVVRAAEDPDHRRHGGELQQFLEAMRTEARKQVQAEAAAALATCRDALAVSEELRGLPAVRRLEGFGAGGAGRGLLELLSYRQKELPGDASAMVAAVGTFKAQTRWQWRTERAPVEREVEVREEYQAQEEYFEEVVVRPASWWRGPKVDAVARTRPVTRTRTVRRRQTVQVERGYLAIVDWRGEVVGRLAVDTVIVPAGRFRMGSSDDSEAHSDEKPAHDVRITRPFTMWTTPMTQADYEPLAGSNPSSGKGAERPVENVSWFDAVARSNALSRACWLPEAYEIRSKNVTWCGLAHPGWRLPTEAEWEYACRAGATAPRHGDLDAIAWHDGNSGRQTQPVGTNQPNVWGLHDMLRNVWEWVRDWKGSYSTAAAVDPVGPASGSRRVFRGGSWSSDARGARAARRVGHSPSYRFGHLGFRPVRSNP